MGTRRTLAAPPVLFAIDTFGHKAPVRSIQDARAKWNRFRDESDAGCSQIGNGVRVVDAAGAFVAYISYNGRVWNMPECEACGIALATRKVSISGGGGVDYLCAACFKENKVHSSEVIS